MSHKRRRSPFDNQDQETAKRVCTNDTNLLSELSQVLNTIQSTPSSGEISAEVLETFKALMLEIDQLSSEDAESIKQESELTLESWFHDLLTKCEGELDLENLSEFDDEENIAFAIVESDDGEEEEIAFAIVESEGEEEEIAFAIVESGDEEDDEEEIIIVDDEGSEVGGSQMLAMCS